MDYTYTLRDYAEQLYDFGYRTKDFGTDEFLRFLMSDLSDEEFKECGRLVGEIK